MNIRNILICTLLALAAVGTRLYQLDRESIWFDESVSAYELHPDITLTDYLKNVRQPDPTEDPLYFSCLWTWSRVFGCGELACRWLSILLGSFSVAFVYLCGREFFEKEAERVAVGLCGVLSLTSIFYSQEVRMCWARGEPSMSLRSPLPRRPHP